MKILYVGDGRCRKNWGAQATSEALHDILASEHQISGIIPSSYKLAACIPLLYNSLYPIEMLYKSKVNFFWNFLWKVGLRVYRDDFITTDMDESIEKFLEMKTKYVRLQEIYEKIENSDAVVLNGEGTIIFSTPPHRVALFFLFILKLSQKMGKKTFFLNGMLSYSPKSEPDEKFISQLISIFKNCEAIGLRDEMSLNILNGFSSEINASFIPDALFTWRKMLNEKYLSLSQSGDLNSNRLVSLSFKDLDFSKDYICLSGGSASVSFFSKQYAIESFVLLVNKLKETRVQVFLVPTCSGDKFLFEVSKQTNTPIIPLDINVKEGGAILANARVFISGRFHPSILASLGNTPCIFMKSNSHKTLSLQNVLAYEGTPIEYEAAPNKTEIDEIYEKTIDILKQGGKRRNKISARVEVLASRAFEENLTLLRE